jgi:hypothetical protein
MEMCAWMPSKVIPAKDTAPVKKNGDPPQAVCPPVVEQRSALQHPPGRAVPDQLS